MHRTVFFIVCVSSSLVSPAFAGQTAQTLQPPEVVRKQARASRVTSGSIRLDGRLDDEVWQTATPIVDFVQAEPVENAAPTNRMEIRFVYDETALWVGARMESSGNIQAPMSRRDEGDQAEYVQIELDTYLDRRTAYMFGVTASGVRLDHFHPSDDESTTDSLYDPVWEAKTASHAGGWTAELWVPFSQLRFNDQPERIWGLNVRRHLPNLNEEVYWALVRRTERGWASRFGDLRGIEDVRPRKRLEILPYVSSSSRVSADRENANPFDSGANLAGRVGADVKVGVGSNLTLDATINPDFGQVEADPAEVNLSVVETVFSERRPFFIEGSNLLGTGNNTYYYSRRIGARPSGTARGDYVDYPDVAGILGAAKLTGRLKSGTSLGFLGAVTNEEKARVAIGSDQSDVKVAPRALWGVGRVLQQFGAEGSTIGANLTVLHRDLSASQPLAAVQARDAITAEVDTDVFFKNRTYTYTGSLGMSFVSGEAAAMARIQQGSIHYLQRPDQKVVQFDPTLRSLRGFEIQSGLSKIAGRHWLWGTSLQAQTRQFDTNDFGRVNFAGDAMASPRLTFRETRPGRIFRAYSLAATFNLYWMLDTELGMRNGVSTNNSFTWKNFWVSTLTTNTYFHGQDAQATRGGPAMGTPTGWQVTNSLRNSRGSATAWSESVSVRGNEFGERSWSVSGSISARPSPSLQFSIDPSYDDEDATSGPMNSTVVRQYLTTVDGGRPETYGKRYIFGLVDRTTLSSQFRVSYTFKPDITLDVYMEPFAASGRYRGIGELPAARARALRMYGTDGTTITRLADGRYTVVDGPSSFTLANRDFNERSFRSNVVLKWEWRPGSTLFGVWQQNRVSSVAEGSHVGASDLFGSLSAPGDNIFAIKSTFWLSR